MVLSMFLFVSANDGFTCEDSDNGLTYDIRGTATLIGEPATLDERGLESSDGLVVISSTTAIWKVNNDLKNVALGESVVFSALPSVTYKINKINYYSEGNSSNNIEIVATIGYEDTCINKNILMEYSCLNNNLNSVNYTCESGCNNGKCLEETCTSEGYKCTSRVRGCGQYAEKNLNCGGSHVGMICCEEIPYCGDGVCFEHDNPNYGETAENCPQDCSRTYEILIKGKLVDQLNGNPVVDAKLMSAYQFSPMDVLTDSSGNFVFKIKTDFRLTEDSLEPATLDERGLESSDGLVVTSPTTAKLKFHNELKDVKLGGYYIYSILNNVVYKINKINYYSDGDSRNNIEIIGMKIQETAEPATLDERGLSSSDGLIVKSPTTATWKVNNEIKDVQLGEYYMFSILEGIVYKINKVNYVGSGNSANSIEIIATKLKIGESDVGAQWTFFKDNYDYAYIVLQRDSDDYSMTLRNTIFDQKETIKDISGKEVVDLGNLKIYPTADISIESDIKFSFNIQYKYKNLQGYNGPGQSGYTKEHYLSNALPLDYDVFVQFEDESGNEYNSSTYHIPLDARGGIVHLSYKNGESKWLILSNLGPTEDSGPIELPEEINGESEIAKSICMGCLKDKGCYPLGYRKSGEYCSEDKTFISQLEADSTCDNNFECSSNLCIDGQCISSSFWQKIMSWFKNLFG